MSLEMSDADAMVIAGEDMVRRAFEKNGGIIPMVIIHPTKHPITGEPFSSPIVLVNNGSENFSREEFAAAIKRIAQGVRASGIVITVEAFVYPVENGAVIKDDARRFEAIVVRVETSKKNRSIFIPILRDGEKATLAEAAIVPDSELGGMFMRLLPEHYMD